MHQHQHRRIAGPDITVMNASAFAHRHELALGIGVKRFEAVKSNVRSAQDVPARRQDDGKRHDDGHKALEHGIDPPRNFFQTALGETAVSLSINT